MATSPAGAVRVNADALAPYNSYGQPPFVARGWYVDSRFRCRDCGRDEVWRAAQQKWWYEVAKGSVESTAVQCRACRRARRAIQLRGRLHVRHGSFVLGALRTTEVKAVRRLAGLALAERLGAGAPVLDIGNLVYRPEGDRLEDAVAAADSLVLVARRGRTVCGCGVMQRAGRIRGRIQCLVVAEGARRQGLGTAMLDWLCARADERGCDTVTFDTRSDGRDLLALLRASGFSASSQRAGITRMQRALPAPSSRRGAPTLA